MGCQLGGLHTNKWFTYILVLVVNISGIPPPFRRDGDNFYGKVFVVKKKVRTLALPLQIMPPGLEEADKPNGIPVKKLSFSAMC